MDQGRRMQGTSRRSYLLGSPRNGSAFHPSPRRPFPFSLILHPPSFILRLIVGLKSGSTGGRFVTVAATPAQERTMHRLDGGHPLGIAIIVLIVLNVTAVILESVASLQARFAVFFDFFEALSLVAFSFEYVVRMWAAPAVSPKYAGFVGRLRYAVTPYAIVDLIAILPSFLLLSQVSSGFDARPLRILRFFRLLRILKVGRYSQAAQVLTKVLHDRRADLVVALGAVLILLVLSSSVIYVAEHNAQPEEFSSIPGSMWWAIITLTTIGYGDVTPVTDLGRIFGAVTALLGVGIVALPAAIMASGFIEELRASRAAAFNCPHCGKKIANR